MLFLRNGLLRWMCSSMYTSIECHVSELIDKLVDVASAEKDKASQDFLWGFVREQVEEEATVQGILDKIKLGGDVALYHLDIQLGARK